MNTLLENIDIENNQEDILFKKILFLVEDIKGNVNKIITLQDFETIFQYIKSSYPNIKKDLKIFFSNPYFVSLINGYIFSNLNLILSKDSNFSFNEITFNLYLLNFLENDNIISSLNTYNEKDLINLFDKYIDLIVNNKDNDFVLGVYIDSFLNLCEIINKFCILSEVDSVRKTIIPGLVKILKDKIELLFQNIEKKDIKIGKKINKILYFYSKLDINFSHISYIDTKNKSLDESLKNLYEITSKQFGGYRLAKESNFGDYIDEEKYIYKTFLGNTSYIILTLISKLEKDFTDKEIVENTFFKKIIEQLLIFIKGGDKIEIKSLDDVKYILENIFCFIYLDDESVILQKNPNLPLSIIKDFINNDNKVNEYQIESIHHIAMFCKSLSVKDLLELGFFLVNKEKFNNYNFEFFKLKTIDVILNIFIDLILEKDSKMILPPESFENKDFYNDINNFLLKVVDYIEENKISSQLLHTYARLYLTIAYYYSFFIDEYSQNLALEYYTIFLKMNGENFEYQKYGKDIDLFAYNIGLFNLNSNLCNCENKENICGINKKGCSFEFNQVKNFGNKKIEEYKEFYEIRLRKELDEMLSSLLENALNQKGIDDKEINKKISLILSRNIFHGIADTKIVEVDNHIESLNGEELTNYLISNYKIPKGIEFFIIDLFNGYRLIFTYPQIYKETFLNIFNKEKSYIVRNIRNLITSYLKRRDLYIDHLTGFPNELKLKIILNNLKENISFIAINLNTIKNINSGYGYQAGDYYIEQIAKKISSIDFLKGKVYRLSGAKFGLLMDEKEIDLELIIKKLKEIKVEILGTTFKLDAFFGVVINDKERIVEKSLSAIAYAKKKGDILAIYDDNINDALQNKEDLDYLNRLDKAIEQDRIIPFFQPIFDAKTKKIFKYEVLLRIDNLDGTFDSPFKYLKAAKKFGRLNLITNLMILKVFQKASKDENNYSINLSGEDLNNEELLSFIKEKISFYKINPSRITFEILEGEWSESGITINIIEKLKKLGFRIAMDDFGADNSNVNRLLDLLKKGVLDELKIDGKIIKYLEDQDQNVCKISSKMLEGIIEACHTAGVKVVAECVENEKINLICSFLGVDYIQGYFYSKPIKDID